MIIAAILTGIIAASFIGTLAMQGSGSLTRNKWRTF